MSTYLSNLTARSFNQAEVLQPRLASRFEPVSIASRPSVQQNLEQPSIALPVPFDLASETRMTEAEIPQQNTNLRSSNRFSASHQSLELEPEQNFFKQKSEILSESNLKTEISQRSLIDLEPKSDIKVNADSDSNRKTLQPVENLESDSQQELRSPSDHTQAATSQIQQQTQQNQPSRIPVETIHPSSLATPTPAIPSVESNEIDPVVNLASDHSTQNPVKQQFPSTENQPLQQSINTQTELIPIITEHRLDSQRIISSNSTAFNINSVRDYIQNDKKSITNNANQNFKISDNRLISESRLTPHIINPVIQSQPRLTSPIIPAVEPVSEPTPTIQVTIGRIEVRAAVAASPSPKPRSAPTVMGLDDYLHQRAKGASQ